MARSRPPQFCPSCGKQLQAIYLNQDNIPLTQRLIGDTFQGYEPCSCQQPPIDNPTEAESDIPIINLYCTLFNLQYKEEYSENDIHYEASLIDEHGEWVINANDLPTPDELWKLLDKFKRPATPSSIEQQAGQPFESFPELAKIIEWFANNVKVPGNKWNELLRQINKAIAGASSNSVHESADVVNALRELVYLKSIKGLEGSEQEYEQRKPLAWAAAKKALGDYNSKKVQSEPTGDVNILLSAIKYISIQHTTKEQEEEGDLEHGYNTMIAVAREALSSYQSKNKGGGE